MTEHTTFDNLHFVFGGARSGKSRFSECLVSTSGDNVLYVATAQVLDDEMRRRVAAHKARRPASWDTLEAYSRTFDKLSGKLDAKTFDGVIIDCIAVWASNIIITLPEISSEDYAQSIILPELKKLFTIVANHPGTTFVAVSNEVGLGIIPSYPLGRLYRDILGRINQEIVQHAKTANFLVAGMPLKIK